MSITFGDHLIDIGYHDITPEQEREIEAREECARRGIDSDELCADGGIEAWMVVDQEIRGKVMSQEEDIRKSERDRLASLLEAHAMKYAPGHDRMLIAIAANIVRRGRELTAVEKLENLKSAFEEADAEAEKSGSGGDQ